MDIFHLITTEYHNIAFGTVVFYAMLNVYAEHTDNNKDKPIAEGDRSTKSYSYIIWLINVASIVQPTFI